ncbi:MULTISPECIES: TetR/AcrR family transcriptional regulator [Salinicola]|uniref:TetR family transcriptional regulator n=1 Tax=Salinicola acroporae TaxID=1541440 RepID=A0ABT6I2H0_9GAMM|nr:MULTISPECIES: TetR/AcrR family transcriptional regulator [Salinicola]MDH4571410.1 TetR family transcriptional regulator [Salinicola acroporae]WIX32795.1 TetR/AcrR family transcriptional regulator [Salinicola sp. JS01]
MSRVSKERAALNREAAVVAASALIREKGLNGIGVRELMASVGLTQGALSKQFGSKEQLAAEACRHAFESASEALSAAAGASDADQPRRLTAFYLEPKAADRSCPMAMLSSDAARCPQASAFRQAYDEGLSAMITDFTGNPPSRDRLALVAAWVGAALLINATQDEALILQIRQAVEQLSETIA